VTPDDYASVAIIVKPNERDQIAAPEFDLADAESKSLLKSGSSWSIDQINLAYKGGVLGQ
jgi:hypothetical protein